jgi:hypothetical protein
MQHAHALLMPKRRPSLTVTYTTDAGAVMPMLSYPVNLTSSGRQIWVRAAAARSTLPPLLNAFGW